LDKAIEIKRRAQRCIQNGDLDGAVSEYTKLVAIEDSDPYNFVLLADLLFKKGDTVEAGQRYLSAAAAYEKAGLYKNAIAVCKKLMRLQLAPVQVYQRLASAHALDGLSTEGSLYYLQHAEYLVRDKKYADAVESLRLAFETSNENVKALERLAEVQVLMQQKDKAVEALLTAAQEYSRGGLLQDAERCRKRAKQLNPAVVLPDGPVSETSAEPPPQPRRLVVPTAGAPREAPARAEVPADAPPKLKTDGTAPEVPARARAPRLEIEPTSRAKASDAADRGARASQRTEDIVPTGATIAHTRPPLQVTHDLDPSGVAENDAANAGEGPDSAAPGSVEGESAESVEADAPRSAEASAPARAPKATPKSGPPRLEPAASVPDDLPLKAGPPSLEIGAVGEDLSSAEADEAALAADPDVRHEPIEIGEEEPAPRAAAPRAKAAEPPGLSFQPAATGGSVPSLNDVERMLSRAQECFRAGQREAASEALAGAARAYDALGRYDSAATIYRSLGKSAHATTEVLQMWIENCERRSDNTEAAQVACELGDRALNEGKTAEARTWFERARDLDAGNEVSLRRLQRLEGPGAERKSAPAEASSLAAPGRQARPAPAPPRVPPPPPAGDEPEGGRVEVAVGRGEAVTFDLGSLINEFQRGVDTQLSGDAQGHYDLAMSYREMGLLEQAVESFRVAARDPALGLRAMEMIGRCYTDQGRFDEAIEEFERALNDESLDPEARLGLQYEIGAAHQAAGRVNEALAAFESVHAQQPDFPNVDSKIRALRKSMGSS
jgi:tetratricopeptide (TPR) repeat protein